MGLKYEPRRDGDLSRGRRAAIERRLVERDGRRCFYCENDFEKRVMAIDHVVPRPRGSDDEENLVLACSLCNFDKSNSPAWYFILRVGIKQLPAKPPRRGLVRFARDGCRSGRTGRPAKALAVVRRPEGSNPSPSEYPQIARKAFEANRFWVPVGSEPSNTANEGAKRPGRQPGDFDLHRDLQPRPRERR